MTATKAEAERSLARMQDYVKLAASSLQLVAGIGAIVYGVGFIVLSTHLARFGVYDFALVKPAYFVAGIGAALVGWGPLVCSCIVAFVMYPRAYALTLLPHWYLAIAIVLLLIFRSITLVLNALLSSPPQHFWAEMSLGGNWLHLVGGEVGAQVGILLLAVVYVVNREGSARLSTQMFFVPVGVMVVLAFSITWATLAYPYITPVLGGGKAPEVRLSIESKSVEALLEGLGVAIEEDSWSTPLILLGESPESLIVLHEGRAVRLDRRGIPAVEYRRLVAPRLRSEGKRR